MNSNSLQKIFIGNFESYTSQVWNQNNIYDSAKKDPLSIAGNLIAKTIHIGLAILADMGRYLAYQIGRYSNSYDGKPTWIASKFLAPSLALTQEKKLL